MKTYVFIIRRICDISGAQQYVYNKMNYLESLGWRVLIFSSMKGHILIDGFRKFEHLILPPLYFSPVCYKKSEVKRTVNTIISEIGDYNPDETIIESDITQRAVWAEIIASRLKCRHLCMLVQEKYKPDVDPDSLIRFKYNRHELSCIATDAIQMLFGEERGSVRPDAHFSAFCNNVILDVSDQYSKLLDPTANCTLGSFGRLDKPCVPFVVKAFYSYVNMNQHKKFNILMIGGSSRKDAEKSIKEVLGGLPNVNLIFTGNVYPVPISFAKKVDVFVSTAGASNATYNVGIPTVRIHPLTGNPVGVMGLDYVGQKSMYDSMTGVSIEECIDKALNQKEEIIYTCDIKEYEEKMKAEFQRQLTFINFTETKEYYPEEKLMNIKPSSHYPFLILWLMGHLFGPKGQTKIWSMFRN